MNNNKFITENDIQTTNINEFLDSILLPEHIDLKDAINGRIKAYVKRIVMQMLFGSNGVKVLIDGDFVAHILGEVNGLFNGMKMCGVISESINTFICKTI